MYEKDAWDSLKREQVFHEQTKQMLSEICGAYRRAVGEFYRFPGFEAQIGPRPSWLRRQLRTIWPTKLIKAVQRD